MDYETLLAAFALIIFVTTLLRLMEQRPTQIYVHACNEYNGQPQRYQQQEWSSDGSAGDSDGDVCNKNKESSPIESPSSTPESPSSPLPPPPPPPSSPVSPKEKTSEDSDDEEHKYLIISSPLEKESSVVKEKEAAQ